MTTRSEAKLATLLEQKDHWQSKDRRWWEKLGANIPAGFDLALIERAVARQIVHGASWVKNLDARCDDMILRHAEAYAAAGDPNWMFVEVAMRVGKFAASARHAALGDLLSLVGGGLRYGARTREAAMRVIDTHPERVEAARAAFATEIAGRADNERWYDLQSEFLPLLAADGSADSLDLLLPFFHAAIEEGKDVDRIRETIVPLLPLDAPAAQAFAAQFTALFENRLDTSPAIAFVKGLGIAAPPRVIAFTVHFRDRDKRSTFKLAVDSSVGNWFRGTLFGTASVTPATLAEVLPASTHDFVLRTQHGLPRAPIAAWVRAQMRPA